ncbi:DUF1080 domain-containing protein [Rhodocytophaga aerolata]|uniref:DUF1080 domain-containing protein n=1 Tax=Rhodocytophaga aerolata TaxID=455078 RepID=A0ABT8RGM0_9BACT|nr:DUF1080 domain-containing protein [Rhodocytophaga aerolata]MDO1451251.1 DUF1080 domain-containing protein [Rhodocytophaga aerolata]
MAGTLLLSGIVCTHVMGQGSAQTQTGKKKQGGQLNTLTAKEQKEGWKLLFDGKSTEAWTGTKGNGFPEKGWVIENGILTVLGSSVGDHSSGGDIITKDQYGSFELSLEFKIPEGANSGIKYFVVNDFPNQKGNYLGMEYQIIDDSRHADAKLGVNGNRTMASLYDMILAKNKQAKPIGEWNQAKIVVKGNHVEHWLNGSKVVDFERGSDEFRQLVAASKYKDLKGFGEMAQGHILLQGHGDTVHYRNIKIRNLPSS